MIEGHAVRRSQGLLRLHLGDHLIQAFGDSEFATIQSAVALLRTVFEDHYVDPEHQSCLFFHGCMLAGARSRPHDFSVVHRGDRVILSEFTFRSSGPACVSIPLANYAAEVVRFGLQVLAGGKGVRTHSDWQRRFVEAQWNALSELTTLGRRFMAGGCANLDAFCDEFHALHGHQKRALELRIFAVDGDFRPREPVTVRARVAFGPLGARESLPMRLNGGDVVLVAVQEFNSEGVILSLEGAGSGGVRPGDRLLGLQLFYP